MRYQRVKWGATLAVGAVLAVGLLALRRGGPVGAATSRAGRAPACSEPAVAAETDERLWSRAGDRAALLRAIDYSLRYLRGGGAAAAYGVTAPRTGITRRRVQRSLWRLRQLLVACRTPQALQAAIAREFTFYAPADSVHCTGYYEPLYAASRRRHDQFRYPLYRLPPRFGSWPFPHPTRAELEGADALHAPDRLRGHEIAWLRDRLEAYLVQVEGSARLRFENGRIVRIAYAGHTAWPYTGLGRQLVADGKISFEALTQQSLIAYFRRNPQELDAYVPRNRRFVFFREAGGGAPGGSLGLPLTPERSIATDKTVMPPGAPALLQIDFTNPEAVARFGRAHVTRLVLDQDAGAAIQGAGRVDLYCGSGAWAGERAGAINAYGRLRYLLLKE